MSECEKPVDGPTGEDEKADESFAHPAEGEQEKSAESSETLSDDEKSG